MAIATHAQRSYRPLMHRGEGQKSRWAIVLSGTEGAQIQLQPAAPENPPRPLQYCTRAGGRTPLQQTLDRAGSVVQPERIVTVIGQGHRKFLADSFARPIPGSIIEQPVNLGTAPGIFLPAAFVSEIDPDATLVILPSDHFVHPEDLFLEYVTHAFEVAERCSDRLILIGAVADRAETDYGWILAEEDEHASQAASDGPRCLRAREFREKPDLDEANALLQKNGLWSTMMLAVKARTLWALGRTCLPKMMSSFDAFRQVLCAVRDGELSPKNEGFALTDLYAQLAPADFSREILERVPAQILVVPMDGVTWGNWGQPSHTTESPVHLDQKPVYRTSRGEA